MLSFAIVSLSPCSAAISSRTGATILQGPHHSAQKSTSTGLSLPSTSLAKLVSVTFTVLPAIGRSPLCRLAVYCPLETHRAVDLLQGPRPRPPDGLLTARRRSRRASARRRSRPPRRCRRR